MIDILKSDYIPTLLDIDEYINSDLFSTFINKLDKFNARVSIEYSLCSLQKGWNIKFKKASKSLCTIYPLINGFIVLVVVGKKEKEAVLKILNDLDKSIIDTYLNSKEANNQRWLMIKASKNNIDDIIKLINIRINNN